MTTSMSGDSSRKTTMRVYLYRQSTYLRIGDPRVTVRTASLYMTLYIPKVSPSIEVVYICSFPLSLKNPYIDKLKICLPQSFRAQVPRVLSRPTLGIWEPSDDPCDAKDAADY